MTTPVSMNTPSPTRHSAPSDAPSRRCALAHTLLAGLFVDVDRMEAQVTGNDVLMAGAVASRLAHSMGADEAHDLVRRCVDTAGARRTSLRAALLEEPRVAAVLSTAELDAVLEPRAHLGANSDLVSAALRAHDDVSIGGRAGGISSRWHTRPPAPATLPHWCWAIRGGRRWLCGTPSSTHWSRTSAWCAGTCPATEGLASRASR